MILATLSGKCILEPGEISSSGEFPGNSRALPYSRPFALPIWLKSSLGGLFGLAIVFVLFGVSPLRAQEAHDSLAGEIGKVLVEEKLVGATWALVTPQGTALGAAGLKDAVLGVPMSPENRVQVGSIAKTFIAVGVLRLVTEQRVNLDTPAAHYLPELPIENPWELTSPLTVRHLLDHTGGLDDARLWQVFSLRAQPSAPLIDGLVHPGGLVQVRHRPGERFSYSNSSYLMLGMLIEAVTGTSYESWLEAELLAPLDMSRSTFEFVTQTGPGGDATLAMGHFDPRTTRESWPTHLRPAGQFTTTAKDMARFARFLMSDGRVNDRVIVDGRLLREMAEPTTTEAARAGLAAGYALGLLRRDRHGVVGRCHLGNTGTFRAALCLYPDQEKAFFISYNSDPEGGGFDRVDAMLVRALGVSSSMQSLKSGNGHPEKWNGLYRVQPNRFSQFAYLDAIFGVSRIHWDGQALQLRRMQGANHALEPMGDAFFRAADRIEATHVLLHSTEGRQIVTDGLRTYERVQTVTVLGLWASAAAGIVALPYLLIVGGVRSVRRLRRGAWSAEPLLLPATCLALLLTTPLLFLTQSLLAIGDPTPANLLAALITGLLPLTLLVAVVHRVKAGIETWPKRVDLLALASALQWCVVLFWWGLLPLMLWR